MAVASITSKGQITIPKGVRDRLNLRTGDKLDFQVAEDGTMSVRPMSHKVDDVFGMLHSPGSERLSVKEMHERLKNSFRKASR